MTVSDIPRMNRRTMLAGATAGAFATSLQPVQAALLPAPDTSFDFDVVVIGAGMTGIAAGLEAAQNGARVALLEKSTERLTGGNTALAGGFFAVPRDDTDAARQAYVEDFEKKAQGRGNTQIYETLAANGRRDVEWLRENGVDFVSESPAAQYRLNTFLVAPGPYMGMPDMLDTLRDRITVAGGEFRFETKAGQLVMDESGAVAGVRAVGRDGVVDFNASAVVMATGGYAANERMLVAYSDPAAGALMVRGVDWATGDGHAMAQEAGAGLVGMGGLMALHIAAVDPEATAAGNPWALLPYTIAVNANGERYIDESRGYVAHGKAVLSQPGQQASLVFGQEIAASDEAQSTLSTFRRLGIEVHEAPSLEDLAGRIGVPADALTRTVEEYNMAIEGDQAPGLEPPKAASARPIQGPTYYAIHPLSPGVTLTFGGIMIDGSARVQEPDGRIIPGLFAAGEGAGAAFYDDYVGGGALANCLVMGRLAGREASS